MSDNPLGHPMHATLRALYHVGALFPFLRSEEGNGPDLLRPYLQRLPGPHTALVHPEPRTRAESAGVYNLGALPTRVAWNDRAAREVHLGPREEKHNRRERVRALARKLPA